jgi:hypothetical protein
MDLRPRRPVISVPGWYTLEYDVLAEDFPPLSFEVELEVTGAFQTVGARINS